MTALSESQEAVDERLLNDAVQLKHLWPDFEARDVLYAVGIDLERKDYQEIKSKFRGKSRAYSQQHGMTIVDEDSKTERAVLMLMLMKYNPESNNQKAAFLTDTMKIVGFPPEVCSTGKAQYMRCYRLLAKKKKEEKARKNQEPPRPTRNVEIPDLEDDANAPSVD